MPSFCFVKYKISKLMSSGQELKLDYTFLGRKMHMANNWCNLEYPQIIHCLEEPLKLERN